MTEVITFERCLSDIKYSEIVLNIVGSYIGSLL